MSCIVQKYGGSSVADTGKIKKIAKLIAETKSAGYDVAVVVSAMSKTTDNLLELAGSISPSPPKRELDMLLSTGERTTMALLCMALHELGVDSVSLTGSQSGIITNERHNDARVIEIRPFRVQDELAKGKVVVVGGFQGVSYKRDITTLGRGGSDTTAVALAAALDAERCEIYSDVDGVYSADPSVSKEARHLPEISYQMMQEMSLAGAKVLNAQAVEFAKEAKIAIYARSTFSPGKETIVRKLAPGLTRGVKAVVSEKNIARIKISTKAAGNGSCLPAGTAGRFGFEQSTIPPAIGGGRNRGPTNSRSDLLLKRLMQFLTERDITIKELNYYNNSDGKDMSSLSFVISKGNVYGWDKIRHDITELEPGSVSIEEGLGALSLIGEGMGNDAAVILETIELLDRNGIEIFGTVTTSFRISFLVRSDKVEDSVRLCHSKWIEGNIF